MYVFKISDEQIIFAVEKKRYVIKSRMEDLEY